MEHRRAANVRAPIRSSPEQVADLIEVMRAATVELAAEENPLLRSSPAVGRATARRLADGAHATAAAARCTLAGLEPELLLEGVSLWMRRRSNSARAQRWSGRKSA